MFGVGIGGVRAQFEAWSLDWWSSSRVPTLGVGIEGVRAQFNAWRLDGRSSRLVRGLQSGL